MTVPVAVELSTTHAAGASGTWWTAPAGNVPWQWYLAGPLDLGNPTEMGTNDRLPDGGGAPDPVIYDIDAIANPATTVAALHAVGAHAICYIEVGTAGDYYTAAEEGIGTTYYQQLSSAGVLGDQLSGYSEYFLNINSPTTVSIIESMIKQQCADKGFDAVETDLDETYNGNEGTTGFTITEADEQAYLTTLADYMHSLGLGWIAKNLDDTGDSFATVMEPLADGIVSEQCNENNTCGALSAYVGHKAIFDAEYASSLYPGFCTYDDMNGLNGALFDANLDGSRSPCPGPGTLLMTTLSGAGHSGTSIAVPTDTAVSDTSTLFGDSADQATGTVTYRVYSDPACTVAVYTGAAEPITTPGALPASAAVTLPTPGTYYWQANYSGDSLNAASESTCGPGDEVETVVPSDPYSYVGGGGTGTAPASGSGPDTTSITLAADTFTRAGYTFVGWSDGTTTYQPGASYTLASDGGAITFTAQWTDITDPYSYVGGGGTGTAPASGSGPDTTSITLAADTFTRAGYTFVGWSDGTTTYQPGASYTLASDGGAITFTAQWTAVTDPYSYVGGGGTGTAPASGSGPDTTSITLAADTFTRAGYTFVGWSDGTTTYQPGASYTLASDGGAITFTAQWTAVTDPYSYVGGGGTGTAPASGSGPDTTSITLAADTFTRAGYTFVGWSDGTTTYQPGASYTLASDGGAITFTAQWTAVTDPYSYVGGGGTGTPPASGSGPDTTSITLAADTFTRAGYTFVGWSDGTTTYQPGASYTLASDGGAITFTAQWTAVTDPYSYVGGGGTGTPPASGSGPDTTSITLAADTFTRAGYTFVGWSDGTTTYQPGASYTLASDGGAITFTAQWTAVIDPGFRISTTSLPAAEPGTPYASQTLTAEGLGASAPGYTTTLEWTRFRLPKGLFVSVTGVLSGTPKSTLAADPNGTITVKATETVITVDGQKKFKTITTVQATISLPVT